MTIYSSSISVSLQFGHESSYINLPNFLSTIPYRKGNTLSQVDYGTVVNTVLSWGL